MSSGQSFDCAGRPRPVLSQCVWVLLFFTSKKSEVGTTTRTRKRWKRWKRWRRWKREKKRKSRKAGSNAGNGGSCPVRGGYTRKPKERASVCACVCVWGTWAKKEEAAATLSQPGPARAGNQAASAGAASILRAEYVGASHCLLRVLFVFCGHVCLSVRPWGKRVFLRRVISKQKSSGFFRSPIHRFCAASRGARWGPSWNAEGPQGILGSEARIRGRRK